MSVKMVIIHAPVQGAPLCQQCLPFDTERLATHTACYWPVREGGSVSAPLLLCEACAYNRRIYTNVRALSLPSGAPVSMIKGSDRTGPVRYEVSEWELDRRRSERSAVHTRMGKGAQSALERNCLDTLAHTFQRLEYGRALAALRRSRQSAPVDVAPAEREPLLRRG